MYAYANNPNPSSHNNNDHRGPRRFEFILKKIEMDENMLIGVFTILVNGTQVRFQGLIKGDPAMMACAMATEFRSWTFSNVNRKTVAEFKEFMERFVSGLEIVNDQ